MGVNQCSFFNTLMSLLLVAFSLLILPRSAVSDGF